MVATQNAPVPADTLADLLAQPLSAHPYDMGPLSQKGTRHSFESLNFGFGQLLVGDVLGESRGRIAPGFPRLTIEEARMIRAEIMRRWNAHARLSAAVDGLIKVVVADLGNPKVTRPEVAFARVALAAAGYLSR